MVSWVTAKSHRDVSWENFEEALQSDFKDVQGGTTPEGIHLGAMAGTVDMIRRCYTGLELRRDGLSFNPLLPDKLKRIKFRLRYRGHWIELDLDKEKIKLNCLGGGAGEIVITLNGENYTLKTGEKLEAKYS